MSNDFAKRFVEWQNYVHYALLTGGLAVFSAWLGAPISWTMTAQLFAGVFIIDTIVHTLFWFAPKPIRWRD